MLSAALQLVFSGMLRVPEYTAQSSTSWDVERTLSPRDVAVGWSSRVVSVAIKVSKTDPFRIGATIKVCETGSQLCPFSALVRYLQIRGASEGHCSSLRVENFLLGITWQLCYIGCSRPRPEHAFSPARGCNSAGSNGGANIRHTIYG